MLSYNTTISVLNKSFEIPGLLQKGSRPSESMIQLNNRDLIGIRMISFAGCIKLTAKYGCRGTTGPLAVACIRTSSSDHRS
ncbi:MAG: hypothetical protein V3T59_04085 [Desulfobacterales bacterium]